MSARPYRELVKFIDRTSREAHIQTVINLEKSVLAAMMLEPTEAKKIIKTLNESDFYLVRHRIIFRAAQKLFVGNLATELHDLAEVLNAQGNLEVIGGVTYLAEVLGLIISPIYAEHHSRLVLRYSLIRQIVDKSQRLGQLSDELDS